MKKRTSSIKIIGVFSLATSLLISGSACNRGGGTSKSGPGNQTVDSNFHVHRDKDGSVPGQPGISPYEGTLKQKRAEATPTPKPQIKRKPS